MLRIDVISQDTKYARIRLVEEDKESTAKAGEIVLSRESFIDLIDAITHVENYEKKFKFVWPQKVT